MHQLSRSKRRDNSTGFSEIDSSRHCRHVDTRISCECKGHGLPYNRIHFIALVRKLGDREMAVAVAYRSFRTRTAK